MRRKPNGASSIYQGKDGKWHGRVTVGIKDDGTPDRRHVERKIEAEVIRAVRELERQREAGKVRTAGQRWTVAQWLSHWVDNIAANAVRENTLAGYRVAVNSHLIPGIGAHRLEKLQPEHLEKLYTNMQRTGSAAGTAHQVHRTVRTALNEAVRRGHITSNPAVLARPPRLSDEEFEPYTVDETRRLLETAANQRNGARWAIALSLGLRQGEALGLRWSDIDLDAGSLVVRRARQRPRWRHGCGGKCGRKMGGHCPERIALRPETADTKSRAGRRAIGLPGELVMLLRKHRTDQEREREIAGQLWREGGWVFATPTGQPVNPRTDYTEWKRLLRSAGLRDGRLHDARHTAATVLLILGVPERAVVAIMGWSNPGMAKVYQHMTGRVRKDIAKRVGGLLWQAGDGTQDGGDEEAAGG
jgi:integrase